MMVFCREVCYNWKGEQKTEHNDCIACNIVRDCKKIKGDGNTVLDHH